MHIAIITVGATGHVNMTLPFVAELKLRGVRITYFSTENFRDSVAFTGADFFPFDSILTNQGKPAKDINKDLIAELPLRLLSEADHIISQILPVMKKDQPDAILYDALAVAGRLAAKSLDIPSIQIFTTYAANDNFSISRNFPPIPDEHPARIEANKLAIKLTKRFGVPHLDLFEIFEGVADFNAVLLQRKFHPAGDTFDDRYFFAGAQISKRDNTGTWNAPSNDKPLIFASLGTLFNDWPEFFHMLFDAVKDMPLNLVSAIGRLNPESLGTAPENVSLAPYLPQLDVLEKASIFITHAGTGSVMESIYFGVPMIAIPQMPEQAFTSIRLEKLGLGKAFLDKNQVTSELLHTTIDEFITKKPYWDQMSEFKQDMRSSGGYEYAATKILEFLEKK